MPTNQNPKMEEDFFRYLPVDIIMEILSRLPILTIIRCKIVHKEWLNLVNSPEFAQVHLSKSLSALGLAVFELEEGMSSDAEPYTVLEIADELSHEESGSYFDTVFDFSFLDDEYIHSSVNGLLFLMDSNLYICNPITRDYIKLSWPECRENLDQFGFGVSKITGQYKIVKICHHSSELAASNCDVYTLGTGSWRRTAAGCPLQLSFDGAGVFFNGNLHWLATDSEMHKQIACFDLETEQFSTFSLPPDHPDELLFCSLCAFGDCLCFCNTDRSDDYEIVIWLMKEYGDEKSWSEEVIIDIDPHSEIYAYFPVKVFKDGDILIVGVEEQNTELWCYSDLTLAIPEPIRYGLCSGDHTSIVTYTPSFIPAKSFQMENVGLF